MGNLSNADCCCIERIIDNKLSLFRQEIINIVNSKELTGFQANTTLLPQVLLADGEQIPLDTVVSDIGSPVTLSGGSLLVNSPGTYYVSYYVNINGTESTISVKIACNGIVSQAESANEGQLTGYALLNLNAGDLITLTNANGESIRLANVDIQADICVIKV